MDGHESGPRARSAGELKEQIEAERLGRPFLVYRDGDGQQHLLVIEDGIESLWVGRSASADLNLDWDAEVSSLHAQLEVVGLECTLVDDGLSRNGSYVNGERVGGRRRLRDGDTLRFGRTGVLYRAPAASGSETVLSGDALTAAGVSPAQKRVLIALCRPFKGGPSFATPAHQRPDRGRAAPERRRGEDPPARPVREVRGRGLPQNQKRVALAERALQSGLVAEREL